MFDLSKIKKEKIIKPPRILIYGSPGLGKTTFAAQAPEPIFIPCEDGFGDLEVAAFPKIQSYEDVIQALDELAAQEHSYKTVVIDTLDKLEKLIWDRVCRDKKKDSIEDIGYAKGYIFALQYFSEVLEKLERLREQKKMGIILTCHSLIKQFNPPTEGSDGYDVYQLDLHHKAAGIVKDWCDFILFLNYKVYTKQTESKKIKAVGQGERFLFTQERPAHWGKSRFRLPYQIEVTDRRSWDAFYEEFKKAISNKTGE